MADPPTDRRDDEDESDDPVDPIDALDDETTDDAPDDAGDDWRGETAGDDGLGEPGSDDSGTDEFGTAPQYFDPVAETSDELPPSPEASREDAMGTGAGAGGSTLSALKATDEAAKHRGLDRSRKLAKLLDDAFEVPGTNYRIGLDPILGILPGGGDLAAALCSLYIVAEAARAGVPRSALAKMLGVVAVDLVIGTVPVVGDLFDAAWKANSWNVSTFEDHVEGTD